MITIVQVEKMKKACFEKEKETNLAITQEQIEQEAIAQLGKNGGIIPIDNEIYIYRTKVSDITGEKKKVGIKLVNGVENFLRRILKLTTWTTTSQVASFIYSLYLVLLWREI